MYTQLQCNPSLNLVHTFLFLFRSIYNSPYSHLNVRKAWKKLILASIWTGQHLNTGQNIQYIWIRFQHFEPQIITNHLSYFHYFIRFFLHLMLSSPCALFLSLCLIFLCLCLLFTSLPSLSLSFLSIYFSVLLLEYFQFLSTVK